MRFGTMLRYGIWAGIVQTADANRRAYSGMTTTWLPHLLTNSVALLLPDMYRLVAPPSQHPHAAPQHPPGGVQAEWHTVQSIFDQLVQDNPGYVAYVAPLAAGYLLSHPQFNIYKGDLAELRFAGFGLDALPHSATAFALTALMCDTAAAVHGDDAARGVLARMLHWGARRPVGFSGAVLAVVTVAWEAGEYRIYRHEMAQRGDMSKINMQWSVGDMLSDCASNAIGWALALAWRRFRGTTGTVELRNL